MEKQQQEKEISDSNSTVDSVPEKKDYSKITYEEVQEMFRSIKQTIADTRKSCANTMESSQRIQDSCKRTTEKIDDFKDQWGQCLQKLVSNIGSSMGKQDLHKQVNQYGQAQKVDNIEELAKIIAQKDHIVFLTGAGISVPSGIQPYRGQGATDGYEVDGILYKNEEIGKYSFMQEKPEIFWKRYVEFYEIIQNVEPNEGHYAIAKYQENIEKKQNKNCTLITQNIDNLHVKAYEKIVKNKPTRYEYQMNPCEDIFQIHGNVTFGRCDKNLCNRHFKFPIDQVKPNFDFPQCQYCKNRGRPNVLYFDEAYDENNFQIESMARKISQQKEGGQTKEQYQEVLDKQCYIVIGTMLETAMANKLVSHCISNDIMLVEINKYDMVVEAGKNSYQLQGSADKLLPQLVDSIIRFQK